ncbi:MAG TPA: KilA-N domain-containing protein [Novosphingobium sp.]|nr:KilA-N domain-containing protein [Novosphingobium sp.]
MASALTVRRRTITQTSDGLVCLDDIWIAAKSPKGKSPAKWRSGQPVRELQIALYEKLYGRTGNYEFARIIRQVKDPQRTFAHPILAVSYASFLSPQLAIEVKEVWLRYAQGDPTLADEILQKSSAEANEWVGVRALSRATRKDYTATLHQHGVKGSGYGACTNAIYEELFDNSAFQLRLRWKIQKHGSLRDSMGLSELTYLMAAESLAKDRIGEENSQGNFECTIASSRSAHFIRKAIDDDKADRNRNRLL